MTDIFDFEPKTDEYAVMGNPISHSKSPAIHTAFAQQTAQRIHYTAIQVDLGGFRQAVGNFFASSGKGLNVTVPFKQEAWQIAEQRSERAELAGAVNTLYLQEGKLFGDNTDGIGLVRDLQQNLTIDLSHKKILILGAGGASRGVLLPILKENVASLVISNRTPDKAYELASLFNAYGAIEGSGFTHLAGKQFDVIINATSASLQGDMPAIPEDIFTKDAWCYDMMYGARPTVFMQWATTLGVPHVSDGLGMLVEQAAEAFYIWRGVRPVTGSVIETIRRGLQ